jgi:hypothetical protein
MLQAAFNQDEPDKPLTNTINEYYDTNKTHKHVKKSH